MSIQGAKLLHALFHAHEKDEQQHILNTLVPNRTIHYIDGKPNNCGPAEIGTNANSAIIETVTNSLDAVIMEHMNRGFFKKEPESVNEALEEINDTQVSKKSKVFVMTQKFTTKFHTVTVLDEGSGIPDVSVTKKDTCLTKSILSYGHGFKVGRKYQHGTYGQGGSSTFPFTTGTLIVTRVPGSDRYYFTLVYHQKFKEDNRYFSSYVYIKDGNSKFYNCTLEELRKFGDVVLTTDGFSKDNVAEDDMILPLHGTVRRMIGMNVNCSPEHSMSIHRAFSDNLFGTNGWVTLISDDPDISTITQTGRRHILDNCQIGDTLLPDPSPVLLDVIPEKEILVSLDEDIKVRVKTWFLDNFRVNDRIQTPARGFFSNIAKNAASTIFVTLNGQTHDKLFNRKLLIEAGYSYLHENIAIEVSLDGVDYDKMPYIMSSTRETLKSDFGYLVNAALVEYFKSHKEFDDWNNYFFEKLDSKSDPNQISIEVNKWMTNPIMGVLSASVGSGGGESSQSPKQIYWFNPNDPPTFLMVQETKIKPNGTAWVIINTDAPDSYRSDIKITLPDFVRAVNNKPVLGNGRMVFQIIAGDVEIGTTAPISVQLNDLHTTSNLIVVAKKRERHKGKKPSAPEIKFVEVNGIEDEKYIQGFAGCEGVDAIMNYNFDTKRRSFTIYLNREDKTWKKMTETLAAKHPKEVLHRFDKQIKMDFATMAMAMLEDDSFGVAGAQDATAMTTLSSFGKGLLVSNAIKIDNAARLNESF